MAFSIDKTDLHGKGVKDWFFGIGVVERRLYLSSTINASAAIGLLLERMMGLMSISLT